MGDYADDDVLTRALLEAADLQAMLHALNVAIFQVQALEGMAGYLTADVWRQHVV